MGEKVSTPPPNRIESNFNPHPKTKPPPPPAPPPNRETRDGTPYPTLTGASFVTISLEEYNKLKKATEESKAEANRAQGALEQLMKKFKEEYDCNTVDEALMLLDKLNNKEQKAKADFDKAMQEFKNKWHDDLNN